MPKLNNLRICVKGEDGSEFHYESPVNVTTEGIFTARQDERLLSISQRLASAHPKVSAGYR